jgi:hypothetical protein
MSRVKWWLEKTNVDFRGKGEGKKAQFLAGKRGLARGGGSAKGAKVRGPFGWYEFYNPQKMVRESQCV